jgi:hypothetical protein
LDTVPGVRLPKKTISQPDFPRKTAKSPSFSRVQGDVARPF